MADQRLLHELCSICNHQTPRYRCPRCSARTCSLPCYKRHQLWSQCSGKRDCAAFVGKSQLATPAGIDHDYNFLSGIERTLDKAERITTDKGIKVRQNGSNGGKMDIPSRTNNLQRRFRGARVIVKNAPLGMARQKLNKTQWNGTDHCITWTVEWVDSTGLRRVARCNETWTLSNAYARTLQNTTSGKAKKRKRKNDAAATEKSDHASEQSPSEQAALETHAEHEVQDRTDPGTILQPPKQGGVDELQSPESIHFYLHKTHTRSVQPVLIPLVSSDIITNSLKNRIVLEFPTIYALPYSPDQLPQDYISESEYFKRRRIERDGEKTTTQGVAESAEPTGGENEAGLINLVEDEIDLDDREDGGISGEEDGPIIDEPVLMPDGTAMDQNRLLDVLKQDIGRAL